MIAALLRRLASDCPPSILSPAERSALRLHAREIDRQSRSEDATVQTPTTPQEPRGGSDGPSGG